jgi:hypothetical protein
MAEAVLCGECKFYGPPEYRNETGHTVWEGCCSRWRYGYPARDKGLLAPNDIVAENDEGWGAIMGPEFGCVLGEKK